MKWNDRSSLLVNKKIYKAGETIPAGLLTSEQIKRFGKKIQHDEKLTKDESKKISEVFGLKVESQVMQKKEEVALPEFAESTEEKQLSKAERKALKRAQYESENKDSE